MPITSSGRGADRDTISTEGKWTAQRFENDFFFALATGLTPRRHSSTGGLMTVCLISAQSG